MRQWLMVSTVAALLLVLVGSSSAQSVGYDLTWHTFDSSGLLQGNGYDLVGIAEPRGPATLAGGSFELVGSFAHPPCSPQAVAAQLSCVAGHVHLDWADNAANAGYEIYRSQTPYQTPLPSEKIDSIQAAPWSDPRVEGCGDAANNYFYVVRAICVGGHADGTEIGEFDFALSPGS